MPKKKNTKKKGTKRKQMYNVLITVKAKVSTKAKALKLQRDAKKKLKGSKVKVTKAK